MADHKKRAEKWRTFIWLRFLPQFFRDLAPRLVSTLIGLLTAVLILLAQIHYGVITSQVHPRLLSILWPYFILALAFALYHLARTPWLISNEHLDTIAGLNRTISEGDSSAENFRSAINAKDEELRTLKAPKRSPAEQHDYDKAKEAIKLVGEKGIQAMRFIRSHGKITFRGPGHAFHQIEPQLPPELTAQVARWAYAHCASEGLLTHEHNISNTEESFSVPLGKAKILDEVLFLET